MGFAFLIPTAFLYWAMTECLSLGHFRSPEQTFIRYPNCTSSDILNCCISSTNIPCSEFNDDQFNVDVCQGSCGIECIDDSDLEEGLEIEAANESSECIDEKPSVCCRFAALNVLCHQERFVGCRKSCRTCTEPQEAPRS